ncbi:MAG: hypothetical protein AAF800_09295 [Planctomycetota bacterium]
MADANALTPPPTAERPGLTVRGPWVVAATLSLFVIVPAVVVAIALVLPEGGGEEPPLDYAERASWPRTFYTAFKSLERGMMSSARTNEVYKDLGFHVAPAEQQAVVRLGALAKQPAEAFFSNGSRSAIEAEVRDRPDLFYGHALLALWHEQHDDPEQAESHWTLAFRHAPAALMRHHTTPGPDGDPVSAAGVPVPPLALVADQIVDDHLDRSLVLVYPHLTSDAEGFVYLPVYKAILRREDPALPPGVPDIQEKYPWFTWVGRIGRLPDVEI